MFQVREIMTHPVISLTETDSLQNARTLMDMHRIRHVPIVGQKERFIGLVTQRDLLGATISHLAEIDAETQQEIDAGIPLKEIMRTDLMTVAPDSSVRDVASTLLNNKYGCLPVVENERLVGIVTEADFLKLTISLMDALDKTS